MPTVVCPRNGLIEIHSSSVNSKRVIRPYYHELESLDSQSQTGLNTIQISPEPKTTILKLMIAMLLSSTKMRFVAPRFKGCSVTLRSLSV